MDRYHADLSTRGSRLQQLQDTWLQQQLSRPGGRPGSAAASVALTPEQRDLAEAAKLFRGLGWQDADTGACDSLLSALLQRARHYKAEAERLHDKEHAAAAAGAGAAPAGSAATAAAAAHAGGGGMPAPVLNWAAAPWSDDGLQPLMEAVLGARRCAAAVETAAGDKPPAAAAAGSPKHSVAWGSAGASPAGDGSAPAAAQAESPLDAAVRLLAGVRWAGLDQLDAASGRTKKLVVNRALRSQQFLAFTAADIAGREAKQRAALAEFEASRRGKAVSSAELEAFYSRLQADGERRKADLLRARQERDEKEAKALALVRVQPGFSKQRVRPQSAAT